MAIIFYTYDQITTIIQSTTSLVTGPTGNKAPEIFFSRDGWEKIKRPIWVTNQSPQRSGGFKHFNGYRDATMEVTLFLFGSNRKTNLSTIKNYLNQAIYIDASDIDSNLTGNYTIVDFRINKNENNSLYRITLLLEEYNN